MTSTVWYPRWYYHTSAAAQLAETPEQEQALLETGEWGESPAHAKELADAKNAGTTVLRTDGPTEAEYRARGYTGPYPPRGFAVNLGPAASLPVTTGEKGPETFVSDARLTTADALERATAELKSADAPDLDKLLGQ